MTQRQYENKLPLGNILMGRGVARLEHVGQALATQQETTGEDKPKLGEILVKNHVISEPELDAALTEQYARNHNQGHNKGLLTSLWSGLSANT